MTAGRVEPAGARIGVVGVSAPLKAGRTRLRVTGCCAAAAPLAECAAAGRARAGVSPALYRVPLPVPPMGWSD